jgi:hypothetical protein
VVDRRATEDVSEPAASPAGTAHFAWKRGVTVALGVATGLLMFELLLRPFVSARVPPLPDIAHDVPAGPLIEARQLDEGVQASRFTGGGSRWTGNAPADQAPAVVIIGDSYVVAREVRDDATMGAWIERFAADAGHPILVRQYGWNAARPAQYVRVASDVLARWSPREVVVLVSDNDFDARALTDTIQPPPLRTDWIRGNSSLFRLVRHRSLSLEPRLAQTANRWKARLGLVTPRASVDTGVPDQPLAPEMVAATAVVADRTPFGLEAEVVRALARAYGDRLSIVYVANTRMGRTPAPDPNEVRLQAACAAQGVRFASTRGPMLDQLRRGLEVRGFSTTMIGSGHLNADGHELVARLIWSMIADDVARWPR